MNQISEAMKAKIYEQWSPKIRQYLSKKGVKVSESRIQDMALMAHTRKIYEGYATSGNTPGRGAFSFGNNPTVAGDATKGSAEMFDKLFGVFIDASAETTALDLLHVTPMQKSSIQVTVAEPVYAGGKKNSITERLMVFQVKATPNSDPDALTVNQSYELHHNSTKVATVEFLGRHLYNGNLIFKLVSIEEAYKSKTIAELFDSATSQAKITSGSGHYTFDPKTVDYVNGFTNFISGFAGSGVNNSGGMSVGRNNGKKLFRPMDRETGESHEVNSYGATVWSRNFSAETFHADINFTTEQIQDARMDHDFDLLQFGTEILKDSLVQSMNNHVSSFIFAAGWQNHKTINEVSGVNLNLNYDSNGSVGGAKSYVGLDDTLREISGAKGVLPASGAINENLSTLQRRLVTRMAYSSSIIKNRGRNGKGDTAILNGTHATAIRDIKGFATAPFENTIDSSGSISNIGSVYGINVYEDSLMNLNDGRIAIFNKGNEKTPGLKLCPYILAESIETVAEGTMAQKFRLKSRYTIAQAGSHPESQYITFDVDTDKNPLV